MRGKEKEHHSPIGWDNTERVCVECGRKFDLMKEDDVAEWYYGHDCEA